MTQRIDGGLNMGAKWNNGETDKSSCVCFQPLLSVIRQTTYRGAHGYGKEVSERPARNSYSAFLLTTKAFE